MCNSIEGGYIGPVLKHLAGRVQGAGVGARPLHNSEDRVSVAFVLAKRGAFARKRRKPYPEPGVVLVHTLMHCTRRCYYLGMYAFPRAIAPTISLVRHGLDQDSK